MLKLLFIAPRFPYPPQKGDQLTIFRRLKVLADLHEITLLSFVEKQPSSEDMKYVSMLCRGGVFTVSFNRTTAILHLIKGACFSSLPLQSLLYQSNKFRLILDDLLQKNTYDVVHFFLIRMAPYVSLVKKYNIPSVLDMVDSMTLNIQRRIPFEKSVLRWGLKYEGKRVERYERNVYHDFHKLIVCAKKDLEYISGKNISIIPSAVMAEEFFPRLNMRKENTFVFSGNLSYPPNIHAVLWFIEQVYPLLKRENITFHVNIIGRCPAEEIKKSVCGKDEIHLVGRVDSMAEALNEASFAIAPMQSGSGMQGKILEAMACGLPVVTTSLGQGSIEAASAQGLFVADTPEEFSSIIIELLRDEKKCRDTGAVARTFILHNHEVSLSLPVLESIYRTAVETSNIDHA